MGVIFSNFEFINDLVWKVTKSGGTSFHVTVSPVTIKKILFL